MSIPYFSCYISCILDEVPTGLTISRANSHVGDITMCWLSLGRSVAEYRWEYKLSKTTDLIKFFEVGWTHFRSPVIWLMAQHALFVLWRINPKNGNWLLSDRAYINQFLEDFDRVRRKRPPIKWMICYLLLGLGCSVPVVEALHVGIDFNHYRILCSLSINQEPKKRTYKIHYPRKV